MSYLGTAGVDINPRDISGHDFGALNGQLGVGGADLEDAFLLLLLLLDVGAEDDAVLALAAGADEVDAVCEGVFDAAAADDGFVDDLWAWGVEPSACAGLAG